MLRFGFSRAAASSLCCALLVTLVCPSATTAGKTRGKVKKGIYHSPHDNFSVAIPPGAFGRRQVTDHLKTVQGLHVGGVSFHGTMGELHGVLYMETPVGFEPSERSWAGWVRRVALPGWFLQASPETELLREEAVTFREMNAYLVLLELPGGSHLFEMKSGRRLDSRRGLLFFVRGSCIYGLMTETLLPPPRIGADLPPVGAEWARFRRGLESFYDDIRFEDAREGYVDH